MEYAHLGRTGLEVSRFCLGTMNFGPLTTEEDSFRIMACALELGINFFATANRYGWMGGRGKSGDTEEIIGHLRSIEGVDVAALFKAYDGDLRVSLRSNGRINVQAAASRLGGGGHFRASGLTFEGPLPEAIKAVESALVAEGL